MIRKTTHAGTWLGRPGRTRLYQEATAQDALRVIEHEWADESVSQVRLIEGDARKGTLVEHLIIDGVEPGSGESLALALWAD